MGENLVIPQDPSASDEARDELAQMGDLFGPLALATRLELVSPDQGRKRGLPFPSDKAIAAKIQRSLRWATVTEVALRLMFEDLDEDTLAHLDAMAACLRISRGLAERRSAQSLVIIEALTEVAEEISGQLGLGPHYLSSHREMLEVFRTHGSHLTPWSAKEVELAVTTLPVRAVLTAASDLSLRVQEWRARIGGSFGTCQYLALDLGQLLATAPVSDEIVSPSRDCLRIVATLSEFESDQMISQVSGTCVTILDRDAAELQSQIELARGAGAPELVIQYSESALVAAATAYQGLTAQGRI